MKTKLQRLFGAKAPRLGRKDPRWGNTIPFLRLVCSGVILVAGANLRLGAQEPPAPTSPLPLPPIHTGPEASADTPPARSLVSRDGELGRQTILRRRERPRLFRASSDTQYLYDSNVLLADGDFIQRGEDAVFIQSFDASFSPRLIEPLGTTIFYRHDLVRYDNFSKFDFDTDSAGLQLSCPVKDWFIAYGGWSASRYDFEDGGEFFKYYDTRFGVRREQPLTRRMLLTCGYQFDWRPASPSELTRIDNAAYLGLSLACTKNLTAQLFYRFRVREYLQAERTDVDHLASLAFVYAFNDWVSARVFGTYGNNDSTVSAQDYHVFNAGGGLGLSIRF